MFGDVRAEFWKLYKNDYEYVVRASGWDAITKMLDDHHAYLLHLEERIEALEKKAKGGESPQLNQGGADGVYE